MLVEKYMYKTNTTIEYVPSELVMAIPSSNSVPSAPTAIKDRWESRKKRLRQAPRIALHAIFKVSTE